MVLTPQYWRLSGWYFFHFAFVGAFSPYFGLYLKSLSIGAWEIGLLMSVMQASRIVAPNLWSWLGDHTGLHGRIISMSALLSLAGYAGFFFSESFVGLLAAMLVLSFFWSAALPLVEAQTLRSLGSEVSRYGRIRLWGSVGFIVAVAALGHLLQTFGERAVLWAGLVTLAGMLVFATGLAEDGTVETARHEAPSLTGLLRRPPVAAFLAASFFMAAGHGALYVFYSIYLVEHGYAGWAVGWLWSLGVVAEILLFLAMPRLMRAVSVHALLTVSLAAAVVRFLMIGWWVESVGIIILAQVLHGLTFGAFHAASVARVNHWFVGAHRARGHALYGSVSFGAGGMLGAAVAGWVWDMVGASAAYIVSAGMALIGLGLVLRWSGTEAVITPTEPAGRAS